MQFNTDPSKQAQEIIFSIKLQKTNHNAVYFNHNSIQRVPSPKHLRLYLDNKLNFQEHLKNAISKVNKTIGSLRKSKDSLTRQSLLTVYKAFIYDQTYSDSFHQKIESVQYNAAQAVTGAVRGIFRQKLYQELGLELLRKKRWYRKLCYFFKIFKDQSAEYLFRILPSVSKAYNTRANDKIPFFSSKYIFLEILFFHQLSLNGIT